MVKGMADTGSTVSVLVTRPRKQGERLARTLAHNGFSVSHVPVMEVQPLVGEPHTSTNRGILQNLRDYDAVIVVSLNAAEQLLFHPAVTISAAQPFYTVGKTTADFMAGQGISIHYPPEKMDSEGLLALPDMQPDSIRGKRILIVRGVGGRELLAETLSQRGARVESCALYSRYRPDDNIGELAAALEACDIVLLNSVESAENFIAMARAAAVDAARLAAEKNLLVPGERVADFLRQQGFGHIITAENATDAATVAALQQFRHGKQPSWHQPG